MKVLLSILFFSVISIVTFAQEYDFRVMINSGNNKVMKEGTSSWEDIKTGTELLTSDRIKIDENGYVILIHKSGSPVELRDSGEKALETITIAEEEGLSSKYMSYVMTKMAPEEQERNRKKYADITGATERGFNEIDIFMKPSSPVFSSNIILRWTDIGKDKKYKVVLENMFDEVIKQYESNSNRLEIDLESGDLSQYQLVSVKIHVLNDENIDSDKYSIQKVGKDELGRYKKEFEELSAALDDDSPMSHLILAEFFEGHKLYLDASTHYEYALKKSNGVDYFHQAYVQFLMRQGWSDVL